MDSIFRLAKEVIICLGEPSPGRLGRLETRQITSPYEYLVEGANEKHLDPKTSLLNRAWFVRRWCVQEVAHRHQTYRIMLGGVISKVDSSQRVSLKTFPWYERVPQFRDTVYRESGTGRVPTMLSALLFFARTECYDPRDRIYALRAFELDGTKVQVDYSLDVRDVYLHAALVLAFDEQMDPRKIRLQTANAADHSLFFFRRVRFRPLFRLLCLASPEFGEESGPESRESREMTLIASTSSSMESWYPDWSQPHIYRWGQATMGGYPMSSLINRGLPYWILDDSDLPFETETVRHSLPSSMRVADNGRCYLCENGTVFRPHQYAEEGISCIWLAYLRDTSGPGASARRMPTCIALLLKPGSTRLDDANDNGPVHRLHDVCWYELGDLPTDEDDIFVHLYNVIAGHFMWQFGIHGEYAHDHECYLE